MTDLQARVESIFRRWFPDCRPILETGSTGSVHGVLVSHSFGGLTDRERQQRLWAPLQRELGDEDRAHVTFILASTPEEQQAIEDFPPDAD